MHGSCAVNIGCTVDDIQLRTHSLFRPEGSTACLGNTALPAYLFVSETVQRYVSMLHTHAYVRTRRYYMNAIIDHDVLKGAKG